MSKHTPGPWSIVKKAKNMSITGNVHVVADKERFPSAFVPAWDDPQKGEEDGTEEAFANARLLSAAPDLLEALKALYAATPDNEGGELGRACMIARAAISKAEGQKP